MANEPWVPVSLERVERLLREKRFAEAGRIGERLAREQPRDAKVWLALARARTGAGDLPGAVIALRQVPDWSLHKGNALFFEGKALIELKRGREAEAAFKACIERESQGASLAVNARLELFVLYAMEERAEAFKTVFWQAYPMLAEPDRLPVLTMRLRLEFEQTEPELNAKALRAFLANDPADYQARAGLAAALDHAGSLSEARALYEEALNKAPVDHENRERYLDVLLRLGEMDTLAQVLQERPSDADDRGEIQKFLGIVAQSRGDAEAAARAFARAVELRPDVAEHHHRLSHALLRLGRNEQAAHEAAERTRLNQARDALRQAWNAFADTYESNPENVPANLVEELARACAEAGLQREADAWNGEAQRLSAGNATKPPDDSHEIDGRKSR